MVQVDIVKCTGENYCKSEEEIRDYFATKFIFILKNEIRFDQQHYGEEAIIKESKVDTSFIGHWQQRQELHISKKDLNLQDLTVKLDDITLLHDSSIFELRKSYMTAFHAEKDLIQGVWVQMDLDLTIVERQGYTALDALADVGGLQGILFSGFSILLSLWNHNHLDRHLVSKLL